MELLNQAEDIVSRKYDCNDENYGLLVLGCYCLLSKFGKNYYPIVEKVMLDTDFFIGKKSIKSLLKDGGIEADKYFSQEELDEDDLVVTAVSAPGLRLSIDDKKKIICERSKPCIFCTTIGEDNTTILNAFVHEASHLVKATVNDIYCDRPTHFLLRSGMNIFGYSFEGNRLREPNSNAMLDEVINVLQTSDMMREIKKLENQPMSSKVLEFYRGLDLERVEDYYGYAELINFVLPLWNNDHFKNSIEDNIVIGRIDRIKNDFDNILGQGSFHYYSTYLDYIDGNYDDSKLISQMKDWYGRMNRLYVIKSRSNYKK